jgi:hypothetical protein
MGRIKLKKVSKLMDLANKFADGKDAYHNKRTCSPEDDRPTVTTTRNVGLTITRGMVQTIR